MTKDSGNVDKPLRTIQNAVTSTDKTCQSSPPFERYWHKPNTLTPSTSKSELKSQSLEKSNKLNVFQTPISTNAVTTIELLKSEPSEVVELESSDEDEVVEVALPPKPTITIESSDEEEIPIVVEPLSAQKKQTQPASTSNEKKNKTRPKNKRRAVSASPVPSVVSSISDDFIRGDCVAFNITRQSEVERFDFSLHGADLLDQHSNKLDQNKKAKKKKSKKNSKEKPTPLEPPSTPSTPTPEKIEHSFSTPHSKQKINKLYTVNESSIPNADVYESDSNQSALIESVTETISAEINTNDKGVNNTMPEQPVQPVELSKSPKTAVQNKENLPSQHVDLTDKDIMMMQVPIPIEDNIVMGNVTGLEPKTSTPMQVPKATRPRITPKTVSNCATAQLPSNNENIIHTTKQSCRDEMERFYNDSWGGEDFDHSEIQRNMTRDKNLWAIDSRDKFIPGAAKRRCHFCNQVGHGYDRCRQKPRICHMCGSEGHYEPRCPNRMCLRCGSPNSIFSIHCRNCSVWNRIFCEICQTYGHPIKYCPDLWRRYHNTTENDGILNRQQWRKKKEELYCSGCTRRGHLCHTCHQLPYSNLPIHSPFANQYRPVFPPEFPTVSVTGRYFTMPGQGPVEQQFGSNQQSHQRHAPILQTPVKNLERTIVHETTPIQRSPLQESLLAKETFENWISTNSNCTTPSSKEKINLSTSEVITQDSTDTLKRRSATPIEQHISKRRSISASEVQNKVGQKNDESCVVSSTTDVLQDSEVSNTSEVVTAAKIYIEKRAMDDLKTKEGEEWLCVTSAQNRIEVNLEESPTTFVHISGLPADQESFQKELKDYLKKKSGDGPSSSSFPAQMEKKDEAATQENEDVSHDIPIKKQKVLRMLNKSLAFLQTDLGDPKSIYNELQFLQNVHKQLLKKKVVSAKSLRNNRKKINDILKVLNMILLGQAGLANGSRHVQELYTLQSIVTKYRKSMLPQDLRDRVGENYHIVFSPVAREDYADLVNKYYGKSVIPPKNGQLNNATNRKKKRNRERKKSKQMNNQGVDNAGDTAANMIANQVANKTKSNVALGNRSKNNEGDGDKSMQKEQIIDTIQSYQKKLRKRFSGDDNKEEWRFILLNKLRKFQVQVKRRGLFQKQHTQLSKLFLDVKKFLGEC